MQQAPRLFTICDIEDELSIFAVGVDMGDEAFTFRREPGTNQPMFGVHSSAESAYRVIRNRYPLELHWPDEDVVHG